MPTVADALEIFRRGPAALLAAIDRVTLEESDFHPSPGKWNIRQIVRHVADTEIVAGMRLRQIAAEDRPTLIAFDQDAWADRLGYDMSDTAESLELFRVVRESTVRVLEGLPPAAFDRTGLHPERGERTLLSFVELFGNHVLKHGAQIQAIRASFAGTV